MENHIQNDIFYNISAEKPLRSQPSSLDIHAGSYFSNKFAI